MRLMLFWDGGTLDGRRAVSVDVAKYFSPQALERAEQLVRRRRATEAVELLARTYGGPDKDGVGVRWHLVEP